MCFSGKPQKGSASGQPVKPDICSWHWGLWNWTLRPIPVFSLQCLTHPHQPYTCSSRSHFYNAGNFRLSFSPSPFLFLSLFFPLLHPLSFKPPLSFEKFQVEWIQCSQTSLHIKSSLCTSARNYLLWRISTLISSKAGFCGVRTKWHNTLQTKSLIKWHWENLASSSFYLPRN